MKKNLTDKAKQHFKVCFDKSTGIDPNCIIWMDNTIAFHVNASYGNFQGMSAHIASYIYHFGSFESKLIVRHTCSNKFCVNPKHLILGTHKDNAIDRFWYEESPKLINVEKVKAIKTCIKYLQKNPDPRINHYYAILEAVSAYWKMDKEIIRRILVGESYSYVKI